jgi:hypothetical protein
MKPTEMKIVFVCRHYWGIGDTIQEARQMARKAGASAEVLRAHIVYVAHPESYVDQMGDLYSPKGFPAKEILRRGVRESNNLYSPKDFQAKEKGCLG